MRKLLLILFAIPLISYADPLDMTTLKCRDMKLTNLTTVADVQGTCLISYQTSNDGLYRIDFRNDSTGDTVTCYFGSNVPSAKLNGCK